MGSAEHPDGREYWEERYAEPGLSWSGEPNPVLVAEIADVTPGVALDVGSGEGADALWLARQGWYVTGVDIASNALEKARAHAVTVDRHAAARIDWQQQDLTDWVPEPQSFDLVSAQFMQLTEPARSVIFRSLATAVAPGGTLLIVGHDASDFRGDSGHRAHLIEKLFSIIDVVTAIDGEGLHVEIAESRQRGTPVAGGADFLHDIVVKASRRVDGASTNVA